MTFFSDNSTIAAAPDLWFTLLKSAAMLCLVLALLFTVLFIMKRFFFNRNKFSERGQIKTIASCHVGPKERVMLLNVLEENVLIGITQQQITCLARIKGKDMHEQSDIDSLKD